MSVAYAEPRAWPKRDADGRTRQKVLRNSREAMSQETPEYLHPRQRRERITAFRAHATRIREEGRRRGHGDAKETAWTQDDRWSYSAIAGDVLEYLMHFAERTGRVFPSYGQIAQAVGCAYRTAVRCIRQLKRGGWLTWERRFVRVAHGGTPEPQVEQTSNLYRLTTPNAAMKLIRAWRAKRPPPPDDVTNARDPDEEHREDLLRRKAAIEELMRAARTPEDRAAIEVIHQKMKMALDQLGASVAARSSTAVDEPGAPT